MTVETALRLQATYRPQFRPASAMICRSIAEVLDLYERVRELERKHHKDLEEYSCIWPEVWFERADQQELRRRLEDLESLDSNRDLWIEGHKEECRC